MHFPARDKVGSSIKRLTLNDDAEETTELDIERNNNAEDREEEHHDEDREEENHDEEDRDEEDREGEDRDEEDREGEDRDEEDRDEEDRDEEDRDEDREERDEEEDEDDEEQEDNGAGNDNQANQEMEQNMAPKRAAFISRTTTFSLVDAIENFNDRQREAVRELGFSRILDLNIKELPLKLAYWVVNSYDHRDSCLELKKNRYIEVQEEDAYRIFSFPRGSQTIDRPRSTPNCDLLEKWYRFFPNRRKIVLKLLAKEMLKGKGGGLWLKRHFEILLIVSLIENTSDGYIHPKVLHYLADPSNAKNLNWGEYALESLKYKKSAFNKKKKVFGGPTLFLMVI